MNTRGTREVRDIAEELGASTSALHVWATLYRDEGETQEEPSRTGYTPWTERRGTKDRGSDEIEALTRERDRLRFEAVALRKTIVLLGRRRD